MCIPKVIHYCWFGRNPKPKLALKCIKSWKRYCPDYEIIEWNEDNFDISACPLYVRQAYEAEKWAFVSDYVRLKVVYDNGGVYLDTDVELRKKLDFLLENKAYFGFDDKEHVATGLGFGAIKNHCIVGEMMKDYESMPFVKADGMFDLRPCTTINTGVFVRAGLKLDGSMQVLADDVVVLPAEYLNPMDYDTRTLRIQEKTVSIHWFSGLWLTELQRKNRDHVAKRAKRVEDIHNIIHLPNRLLQRILGSQKYEVLKNRLKRG